MSTNCGAKYFYHKKYTDSQIDKLEIWCCSHPLATERLIKKVMIYCAQ